MPAQPTGISWTDWSGNNWWGCAKCSEGCANCWAETMFTRMDRTEKPWTVANVDVNLGYYDEEFIETLEEIPGQRWVFCPSSSDPYLPWLKQTAYDEWYEAVCEVDQHVYQVLTKWGPEKGVDADPFPEHVMLGVSVEAPNRTYRIDWLREQEAGMKFVSFEPLIEPIPDVDLEGIDWILVGGESHPDADDRREMERMWPVSLYETARDYDLPFFFKQHSAAHAEKDTKLAVPPEYVEREIHETPETPAGLPDAPREFMEEA